MVRKIQNGEYLRRYDNMTAEECEGYESRVGKWLSESSQMLSEKGELFVARVQNVLQVSGAWNDQECQAFEEGVRLLSALVGIGDTWLPDMLYVKSAKRAIKQMCEALRSVNEENGTSRQNRETQDEGGADMRAGAAKETPIRPAAPFHGNAGNGDIAGGNKQGETNPQPLKESKELKDTPPSGGRGADTVLPARPKHIDQYVHLLPQKTQEHAALVQGLYRELDEAREKLNLLMNDGTASAADREAWAKKATKCDNTLRKILDELDAEWAKLVESGRVVVDDLGNARIVSLTPDPSPEGAGSGSSPLGDGGLVLSSKDKARRRDLRKWLVDTRRGNGDTREEHVKKWIENFREYLTMEGDKAFDDEKINEAIGHYGIDVTTLCLHDKSSNSPIVK